MAVLKTNINDINEKNYAEFDLGLICEEKYKSLKHIDMVIYTMLKNQHGLSIRSVMMGNKRFVDSKGNIFISMSQEKICKIVRTTKPTLNASLKRLAEVDLIENIPMGNMQCNRIYVGKLERTTTLGDYIKSINLDNEIEDYEVSIDVVNMDDVEEMKKASAGQTTEASEKSSLNRNNSIDNISYSKKKDNSKKCKKEFKSNYNKSNVRRNSFNDGTNNTFTNYEPDELEKLLFESQKGKFK